MNDSNSDGGRRFFNGDQNHGTKHLPFSKLMNRRATGLCFLCGERYHPLHQCTERQLGLVVLGDDERVIEEEEVLVLKLRGKRTEIA